MPRWICIHGVDRRKCDECDRNLQAEARKIVEAEEAAARHLAGKERDG